MNHIDFFLGFFSGGFLVGLAALQFIKGYREGMRTAIKDAFEEARKTLNQEP